MRYRRVSRRSDQTRDHSNAAPGRELKTNERTESDKSGASLNGLHDYQTLAQP